MNPAPGGRQKLWVYAVGCSWNGPIEKTARVKGGHIPCCPHCGSVLFQSDTDEWHKGVAKHEEKGHHNYADFMKWCSESGRCFKSLNIASIAYQEATGKQVLL